MADQESCLDVQILKKTKISVYVDEALPDILVCTYEFGVKIFKGVLLDSTKRNLPCGVQTLNPAFTAKPDEDSLYSVNQRFAYTDPQNQQNQKKKNVHISSKYKNNKMTVRLRPRQVLCSKCKGICNENSENVSRKRKISDRAPSPVPIIKRSANAPVTRSAHNTEASSKKKTATAVVAEEKPQPAEVQKEAPQKEKETQKLNRVSPQEMPTALSGNVNKLNIDNNSKKPLLNAMNLNNKCASTINNVNSAINSKLDNTHSLDHSELNTNSVNESEEKEKPEIAKPPEAANNKSIKRILRKKRSVGSMEDLWDETVFEEKGNKNPANNPNGPGDVNTCPSTRTIKISYGPQGEGTVLKIPAQIENLTVSDDSEENINIDDPKLKPKDASNKAARKALKKAKKEARRKVLLSGSPMYVGNASPRYAAVSGLSPRYTIGNASPRYALGNNSPRYLGNASFDVNTSRRRKHKMKHKKKHREDKERKHKDAENTSVPEETTKEQCVTQKLSINLKRLNNTYTSVVDKTEDSSSDDNSDQVPDFPPPNPPLMLRINAKTVSSAPGADGSRLLVGDVVWGKILGFPWWPGKVLTITNTDNQPPQAHVAWYGSCTSSLMQCDQLSPYLENFKIRYNKKKRGPYKEAIKQATTEARENAENRLRDQIASSPARSIITVVPPALASPREIDVVS